MSFIRTVFSIISICLPEERAFNNKFLEECLLCFKMCGDGKKYIDFVRYSVCNMYRNYIRYFVGQDLVYIYFLRYRV